MAVPGYRLEALAPGVVVLRPQESSAGAADPAALLRLVDQALEAGAHRVEAEVPVSDVGARRHLQRAGLRPEGVSRGRGSGADGIPVDVLRMARLREDPRPGTRAARLALLNAVLPTKRVIAQGLVRDPTGRVLLCELTYKQEWDLPGGVVDPRESPADALHREVGEELGVDLPVRRLLAVDWLPPYRQWDDAVLLGFDLGVHEGLDARILLEAAEIASVHWCDPDAVLERMAPYAARLVGQLLAAQAEGGVRYLEDGYPALADTSGGDSTRLTGG